MSFWNVLLVIIVILAILLVVLYILGSRMQKRQAEQQTMIDASKQTVSILAIDKKKLKIGDSGLPKMVIDQTPWYMKWAKLPIVKAKIGPKVVTMIADEKVFLQLPHRGKGCHQRSLYHRDQERARRHPAAAEEEKIL